MALQGPIPVEFGQVFPDGVYAAGGFEALPVANDLPAQKWNLEGSTYVP